MQLVCQRRGSTATVPGLPTEARVADIPVGSECVRHLEIEVGPLFPVHISMGTWGSQREQEHTPDKMAQKPKTVKRTDTVPSINN
jgi:hypothetical protein